jgi:anhydro-N-acetylmuramic acid kinase
LSVIMRKSYLAFGTMTGTSMDGIDVAAIETDGLQVVRSRGHVHVPYALSFQKRLKEAEKLAHEQCGAFNDEALVAELTELHIVALAQLRDACALGSRPIDVIGFHGQTLFHAPKNKLTLQIGDGAKIAAHFKCPVVDQFRIDDVQAGGQGAPLAPAYHQALVLRDGLAPTAVINCGGIANISMVSGAGWAQVFASDVGPGNVLLDRFVRDVSKGARAFDEDGLWALQGAVDPVYLAALHRLNSRPVVWPSSFDSYDFTLPAYEGLHHFNICATLAFYTGQKMAVALLDQCRHLNIHVKAVVFCGGGWYNPAIVDAFKVAMPQQVLCQFSSDVNWCSDAIEAETFAYLAVKNLKNLTGSAPNTTGVPYPMVCGRLHLGTV